MVLPKSISLIALDLGKHLNCISSEEILCTNPIITLKYIITESTNIIMFGSKNNKYLIARELYIFRGNKKYIFWL